MEYSPGPQRCLYYKLSKTNCVWPFVVKSCFFCIAFSRLRLETGCLLLKPGVILSNMYNWGLLAVTWRVCLMGYKVTSVNQWFDLYFDVGFVLCYDGFNLHGSTEMQSMYSRMKTWSLTVKKTNKVISRIIMLSVFCFILNVLFIQY